MTNFIETAIALIRSRLLTEREAGDVHHAAAAVHQPLHHMFGFGGMAGAAGLGCVIEPAGRADHPLVGLLK